LLDEYASVTKTVVPLTITLINSNGCCAAGESPRETADRARKAILQLSAGQ